MTATVFWNWFIFTIISFTTIHWVIHNDVCDINHNQHELVKTREQQKQQQTILILILQIKSEKFLHKTAMACDSNRRASLVRERCSRIILWFGVFFSKIRKPFDNAIVYEFCFCSFVSSMNHNHMLLHLCPFWSYTESDGEMWVGGDGGEDMKRF